MFIYPYPLGTAISVLQARLFSYPDTHRHRLGVNYQQLPVNAPICPVANFRASLKRFLLSLTAPAA